MRPGASSIWGSFDTTPPPVTSNSNAGYSGDASAMSGDFLGGGGAPLSAPAVSAPIDARTLPNPNNPGGISDMELASRVRNLQTTATTTANNNINRNLAPATPVMTQELSDQLTAMGSGATGAYNAVSDSGRAQYDYMHDLGSPDFLQTPAQVLNRMGEGVGVSHAGDAMNPNPFAGGISNPFTTNPLSNVLDVNHGLGTTVADDGRGGKPIAAIAPDAAKLAGQSPVQTTVDAFGNAAGQFIGDNFVPSGSGSGGGGGGAPGSGTTLDQGRGISLPDQLVYARGDIGATKDLQNSIRNGEFAPPSDARQIQLDTIGAAGAFADAARGPGMGSFLTPPPSPSQQVLRQPAGAPAPGAQPQATTMQLQGTGPLGPAAAAAAGQPLPATSTAQPQLSTRAPMPTSPALPTHSTPLMNPPSPSTNPTFAPGSFAPPTPAAPPQDPLRATLGARQDVGSYLTGSRATDPWSAQVQGFLQAPEGPSAAQAQLTQGRDASMADALSLARSGRGGAGQQARALRGAFAQNAATMGQTNQAAALLRANEAQNYKQQQLQGLGLGANIAAGKDQNTLSALGLSGNLAQGIDQDTLAGDTLKANTAQGMRGLDITEAGQTLSGVLDADKIAAGREGDILNASTSAYATDRGIDAKGPALGPGDIKYWTDKI